MSPSEGTPGQSGNTNDDAIVDEILNYIRNNPEIRRKYDPLRVRSIKTKEGSANDVKIYGLLNLARSGPATFTAENGSFVIDVNLGLNQVSGDACYKLNRCCCKKGKISANIDSIASNLRIAIDDGKAALQNFSIGSMSCVVVTKFSGASFLFNGLVKSKINQKLRKKETREKIRSKIESVAREAIAEELRKINFDQFTFKE